MTSFFDYQLGRKIRYHKWMTHVAEWADHHKISIDQAMNILFETQSLKNKMTAKELLSWSECDDFYLDYKENK